MKFFLPVLITVATLGYGCQQEESNQKITIKGRVHQRNSDTLLLVKSGEDWRYQNISIPIDQDSTFYFEFNKPEYEIQYELVFQDEKYIRRAIPFIPEVDSIEFELYPLKQWEKNITKGSSALNQLKEFQKLDREAFRDSYGELYEKLDSVDESDSVLVQSVNNQLDSLRDQEINWMLKYFKVKNNVFAYAQLIDLLKYNNFHGHFPENLMEVVAHFGSEFPTHPYTMDVTLRLESMKKVQVGGSYRDFSVLDSLGKSHLASELVSKNNIILIDLWSPWCGFCIKKSLSIKSEYVDLRNKGFEVFAVLGGIRDISEYEKAVKKYQYPWPVYIELNAENDIWSKYNIDNAGGGQFLIGQSGKILAVNPTVEEIKSFL
tara:strand:- start:388 stop:1515 length:1128 start_codon:yes stop_codon:yes gene_type:complete